MPRTNCNLSASAYGWAAFRPPAGAPPLRAFNRNLPDSRGGHDRVFSVECGRHYHAGTFGPLSPLASRPCFLFKFILVLKIQPWVFRQMEQWGENGRQRVKDYTQANNLIANSSQFAHAVYRGKPYGAREKLVPLGGGVVIIASLMKCDVAMESRGGSASAILHFLATGHSLAPSFWLLPPPRLHFYSHVLLTSQSSSLQRKAPNIIHQDWSWLYCEAQAVAGTLRE